MSATTRLNQSTSLGTTLAQSPTPLPNPKKIRVGATAPTRLVNPPSMVTGIRPPVSLPDIVGGAGSDFGDVASGRLIDAILAGGVKNTPPPTISPEEKAQAEALINAHNSIFNTPLLQSLFPPIFDLPGHNGSASIRNLPPPVDMTGEFAQRDAAIRDALNPNLPQPTEAVPTTPIPEAQMREPQDVTPANPVLNYTPDVPDTRANRILPPKLLSGIQPPVRDTGAEAKNRNAGIMLSTALPLIAALFGGDTNEALRMGPANLATALAGAGQGADSDFAKAVQAWQLAQGAVDTENQRLQTGFLNESSLADRDIREAVQNSLANSRAGTLDVAQHRENRLTNGVKIRQNENDRQAFNKGLEYLRTLNSDEERTAALSDPRLLASFGFDELSPQEAEILSTLSKRERPGASQEQHALLSELNIWAQRWVDPTIKPEDKPRIWDNMQRLLGALGSPNAEIGSAAIVPSNMKPIDAARLKVMQGNLAVAQRNADYSKKRTDAYVAHLAKLDSLTGDKQAKDIDSMLNAVEDDINTANQQTEHDPMKLILNSAEAATLDPADKKQIQDYLAAQEAHKAFLRETKRELLRRRAALKEKGFTGASTPMGNGATATETQGPTQLPLPKGSGQQGAQPVTKKPAAAASRATSPKRSIATPASTPPASTAGGNRPTAFIQTPVISGASGGAGSVAGLTVGATTPSGQPTAKSAAPAKPSATVRPKAAAARPAPRPSPSAQTTHRTPDGYIIQTGP